MWLDCTTIARNQSYRSSFHYHNQSYRSSFHFHNQSYRSSFHFHNQSYRLIACCSSYSTIDWFVGEELMWLDCMMAVVVDSSYCSIAVVAVVGHNLRTIE
jgi:hypothetical protein